jgi:hypothetical protein
MMYRLHDACKCEVILIDVITICILKYVSFAFQSSNLLDSSSDGPQAKKHAGDKKVAADKKKLLKEKKRTLKRL